MPLRKEMRKILQQEDELVEIVQLVGKDSLSEDQKVILKTATIIKDEFLQQNAFSEKDYTCPMAKTSGMMKCIVRFYERAMQLIKDSEKSERKISMAQIEHHLKNENEPLKDVMYQLTQMKYEIPTQEPAVLKKWFDDFTDLIDERFRAMTI